MAVQCEKCLSHLHEMGWSLVGAAASVGIERGASTSEMVGRFLNAYHERGHQPS